jgi:hypothetical protein
MTDVEPVGYSAELLPYDDAAKKNPSTGMNNGTLLWMWLGGFSLPTAMFLSLYRKTKRHRAINMRKRLK